VSNVPAQALTMMNNPLVLAEAELWAKNTAAGEQARDRITRMYLAALARPPSPEEFDEANAFLDEQGQIHGRPDDPRAWTDFGHALFNVKEFIFVN